ncbi:MAG: PDZ domain-containing protein, partial [Bacteroidetes bacterium]|nr:PDZ domain-containing protein [Bacteroidota bacterium]
VNAPNELQSYVATRRPGDEVTLKIFRDGKTIEKRVNLKMRDQDSTALAASGSGEDEPETVAEAESVVELEKLGISVRSMTASEKAELGSSGGVIVAKVKRYSEAFNRGIRENQVIVEADRKQLESPSQLKRIVDGHKAGESLLLRIQVEDQTAFVAVQIPE